MNLQQSLEVGDEMVIVKDMNKADFISTIADIAVLSLLEELELTPKPGLVDKNDPGAHDDLSMNMMKQSALSLKETFYKIAEVSFSRSPSQRLREEIAKIGRDGEAKMFEVTEGVNTHKGAIWALGLLVSAVASGKGTLSIKETLRTAGQIARYPDRFYQDTTLTNGKRVKKKYGVKGAKEQGEEGFPHILHYAIPALEHARRMKMSEEDARKYTLIALIAHLDDTCILHRGGMEALTFAKNEALKILKSKNLNLLDTLNEAFIRRNISPGGSADLLAATIFLDKVRDIYLFHEIN